MFKLIFKTIVIFVFAIMLTIVLAVWKGGAPFRTAGAVVEDAGRAIFKFGDIVDDFISGGRKLNRHYEQLKDIVSSEGDRTSGRRK